MPPAAPTDPAEGARPRTIVLIAGPKSHGPEGNGAHDYPWDARVAAAMLRRSNIAGQVQVRVVLDGWPTDPTVLADADGIALFCDGRDGDRFREALHLESPERVAEVAALMARGCGLAVIHFGTFAGEAHAAQVLDWNGGYFQWQGDDGARAWRSRITRLEAPVLPQASATPQALSHPALNGVGPFRLAEEFYHDLRFPPAADATWIPLLAVPALPAQRERGTVVAWARERADGGRGFGTTLGHDHANWRLPEYRTGLLNGIAWAAGVAIPAAGVQAPYLTRDQAAVVLAGAVDDRLRVLLLAGNDAHRWHNWERTTPAIRAALERDPRVTVEVIREPDELGRRRLADYGAIVLNYCNWEDPTGISEAARAALTDFVAGGGGLVVLHFANGAFHHSLPRAGASDWPEYRRLVRRVWDHTPDADGRTSAHDPFGWFIAIPGGEHPISDGLTAFALQDELYHRQRGELPISPILSARSVQSGALEPLAWTYGYGAGRVFQTLLGHDQRAYEAFAVREMLRRGVAWTAGREVVRLAPAEDPSPAPAVPASATRSATATA